MNRSRAWNSVHTLIAYMKMLATSRHASSTGASSPRRADDSPRDRWTCKVWDGVGYWLNLSDIALKHKWIEPCTISSLESLVLDATSIDWIESRTKPLVSTSSLHAAVAYPIHHLKNLLRILSKSCYLFFVLDWSFSFFCLGLVHLPSPKHLCTCASSSMSFPVHIELYQRRLERRLRTVQLDMKI